MRLWNQCIAVYARCLIMDEEQNCGTFKHAVFASEDTDRFGILRRKEI